MFIPKSLKLTNFLSHTNTYFEFRQGRAVLVVGENLDKEGTKGNGAGKSSLNEGVSVALTGSSIRDVKPRELVRNGCDYAEVELILYNTMYRCELKILRKLYSSQSKSSECKIWENEVEVTSCSDINTYNKFILSTLNISKEDLFNFYIITKEQYQPFLSVGDTKKKEIINRFSGADIVDKTEFLIDLDSSEIEVKIKSKQTELVTCQGKQQLYSDEIIKEKNLISDEETEKKKQLIDNSIAVEEDNILFKRNELQSTSNEILTKEVELAKKIKEKIDTTELEKLSIIKINLSNEKLDITQKSKDVTNEFQSEIDEVKFIEEESKGEIRKYSQLVRTSLEVKQQLENKLVGLIDCPKCHHQFTLKEKDIVVEDVKKSIIESDKEISDFQKIVDDNNSTLKELEDIKLDINNRITEKRKVYQDRLSVINQEVLTLTEKENQINLEYKKHQVVISNLQVEIGSLKQKIEHLTTQIENIETQITSLNEKKKLLDQKDTTRLEELATQLEKQEELEIKLKEEEGNLIFEKQKVDEWYINFKNFKSFLANQSIRNISDYTNFFLQAIGSNITINIEGYRMMSNKKLKEEISTLVYKNGIEEGSYGKFSAGERGRIEISVILAMKELLDLNNPSGGLDLLICDEILDSVDDLGLENILNALQGLDKTIMIVSQNQINSLKENTITIRKENKISEVIC